mgnify:FL=1
MNTIKPLTDGEFNVSLKDDVQPVEFTGSEEIEVFSTWVKAKYTRVALKATKAMDTDIRRLASYGRIDVTTTGVGGRDFTVRNDVDDKSLDILLHNEVISRPLYEYCLRNQVDEIIFLA